VRALTVSDALWATSMTPEGLLEAWRAQDGARVSDLVQPDDRIGWVADR